MIIWLIGLTCAELSAKPSSESKPAEEQRKAAANPLAIAPNRLKWVVAQTCQPMKSALQLLRLISTSIEIGNGPRTNYALIRDRSESKISLNQKCQFRDNTLITTSELPRESNSSEMGWKNKCFKHHPLHHIIWHMTNVKPVSVLHIMSRQRLHFMDSQFHHSPIPAYQPMRNEVFTVAVGAGLGGFGLVRPSAAFSAWLVCHCMQKECWNSK
eukprot:4545292-Amphidinium_carterae.3